MRGAPGARGKDADALPPRAACTVVRHEASPGASRARGRRKAGAVASKASGRRGAAVAQARKACRRPPFAEASAAASGGGRGAPAGSKLGVRPVSRRRFPAGGEVAARRVTLYSSYDRIDEPLEDDRALRADPGLRPDPQSARAFGSFRLLLRGRPGGEANPRAGLRRGDDQLQPEATVLDRLPGHGRPLYFRNNPRGTKKHNRIDTIDRQQPRRHLHCRRRGWGPGAIWTRIGTLADRELSRGDSLAQWGGRAPRRRAGA